MTAPRKRPPRPPGIRLATVAEVRTELATIYRLARRHPERLAWSEATKAAHILNTLARMIEGSEFERRIAELEKRLAERETADRDRQRRTNGGSPWGPEARQ
jgi:hypothetical protein